MSKHARRLMWGKKPGQDIGNDLLRSTFGSLRIMFCRGLRRLLSLGHREQQMAVTSVRSFTEEGKPWNSRLDDRTALFLEKKTTVSTNENHRPPGYFAGVCPVYKGASNLIRALQWKHLDWIIITAPQKSTALIEWPLTPRQLKATAVVLAWALFWRTQSN